MTARLALASLALVLAGSFGCASSELDDVDAAGNAVRTSVDAIDRPTPVRDAAGKTLRLELGLWHKNVLTPTVGWHSYHFVAEKTGYVSFMMKAAEGDRTVWSYLRIEEEDPTGVKPWVHNTASVGSNVTNLCEIILHVEEGKLYEVITTSQHNLTPRAAGTNHPSNGEYTVAVLPMDIAFP